MADEKNTVEDNEQFKDPSNVNELIQGIPSDNHYDILQYAKKVLPGWIIKVGKQFSIELNKFNYQWSRGCVVLRCEPKKVLLVTSTFLSFHGTTHKLVKELIQKLSEKGYVVIDAYNFDFCTQCTKAIVCEARMKEKGYYFSGKCRECFDYDPRYPLDKQPSKPAQT